MVFISIVTGGEALGRSLGGMVGEPVVGEELGAAECISEGEELGAAECVSEGIPEGPELGFVVGAKLGCADGAIEGVEDGIVEGLGVGG